MFLLAGVLFLLGVLFYTLGVAGVWQFPPELGAILLVAFFTFATLSAAAGMLFSRRK